MNRFGRDLVKQLGKIGERRNPLDAFRSFVHLSACAVAAGTRETEYLDEIGRWDREAANEFAEAFAMLVAGMTEEPYRDLMGPVYMELGSRSTQSWNGEFYTPQEVCDLMARMNFQGVTIPPDRPIEIAEPACGAGAMMLSVAKAVKDAGYSPLNMRATCVDVSRLACDMCYVNLTLWGIPATVIHGNTLSLETWAGWRNMWWNAARGSAATKTEATLLALLDMIGGGPEPDQPTPSEPTIIEESARIEIVEAIQEGPQFAFTF